MQKHYKQKRLGKVIPVIKGKIDEDLANVGKIKSRTLDVWLGHINLHLCRQEKIKNNNELKGVFKKLKKQFRITKKIKSISCDGYKLTKTFYKFEPNGYRN